MRDTMAAATGLFTLPDIPEFPSPGMAHRADADCQGWRTKSHSLNGFTAVMTGRGGQGKRAAHVDYTCMRLLFYRFVCLKTYFCAHAMMQERKTNPRTLNFLPVMIRNAEVRFVFQGRIEESDQVLGMSDPGARAERGQSSPERSALKVENHQDFRPHRAVPEADGDEMPLEPDGPSVLLPRKTSPPAHFVLKAKRSCPTNPNVSDM